MTQEALKLALEALEKYCTPYLDGTHPADESITAIKEALAQTQEPDVQETLHWHAFNYRQAHTAQAHEMWQKLEQFVDSKIKASQRTWVGLTDDEIAEIESEYIVDYRIPAGSAWNFARAIEAKLKDRNTNGQA